MGIDGYSISFDREAFMALKTAIIAGALHERNRQLTELIIHNRQYSGGLANASEREIDALTRAAWAITSA